MAHLAIYARLRELQIVRLKSSAFHIAQLAGVTNRAIRLVVGGCAEPFPGRGISPLTARESITFQKLTHLF
jgi:hypothetical protein